MKKVLLIVMALLLCSMPLCSFGLSSIEDEEGYGDPPIFPIPCILEMVKVEVFNIDGELTYQGDASIVSGELLVDTTGWEQGTYTAYVKTGSRANTVFTIICE